ncbi:MAG: T9SS type A sorting domain-containing protein [Bacteroidales bacterium]|nr:T9SS type A sorting domain-containing protein [Bacteroidales bacterium]
MKQKSFWLLVLFFSISNIGFAQYDGIVGSEGCMAISHDDSRIVAWATDCHVQRGYYDIAKNRRLASFGTDSNAIGHATTIPDQKVVSLGDSGVATLTFARPITNGEGFDFVVFENSLNHTFLELAFVEVSSDGERFVRFPSVSNTPCNKQVSGATGPVDATKIHNLAGKYCIGWGTPFDLEELKDSAGLDIYNITHVRMVDVIGTIDSAYASRDSRGNIINEPYPTPYNTGGFDLAGVGVLHRVVNVTEPAESRFRLHPNPCNDYFICQNLSAQNINISLYSSNGKLLKQWQQQEEQLQMDVSGLPCGIYWLRVGNEVQKLVIVR